MVKATHDDTMPMEKKVEKKVISSETTSSMVNKDACATACAEGMPKCRKCLVPTLLVINIILSIIAIAYPPMAMERMEAMKVGGPENYAKIKELMKNEKYIENQRQSIDMIMSQMTASDTSGTDGMMMPEDTMNASGSETMPMNDANEMGQ